MKRAGTRLLDLFRGSLLLALLVLAGCDQLPFMPGKDTGGPELTVARFEVSPDETPLGGTVLIDLLISNRGERPAEETLTHVRLNRDPAGTSTADLRLLGIPTPGLEPGASHHIQQAVTIPVELEYGIHYVWVQLDADDKTGSRAADGSRAMSPLLLTQTRDYLPITTCTDLPLDASGNRARTSHVADWQLEGGSSLSLAALELDVPYPTPRAEAPELPAPGEWDNRYPGPRSYFTLNCGDRLGFVWQPAAGRDAVVTLTSPGFSAHGSWQLPLNGDQLVAAAYGEDSLYYVTIGTGTDISRSALITVHRLSLTNGGYVNYVLDTEREAFNSVESDRPWSGHASLAYSDGQLGLIMNRLMHRSADGLNHQGAFAATFDASSLELLANLGQTSGHSFGSYLAPAAGGGFLGIDHGDNYPRGIHLHRFDGHLASSRVVYTFKTLHGTTPQNSAGTTFPVYDEISTRSQTYYRWSNDNNIYGELGAALELENGIAVLFIGESGPAGESLNNVRTGELLNDARNIGVVLVRHDFEAASRGEGRNVVTDDLVLSSGPGSVSEAGGFYNFNGGWDPQRNAGVRWLTHYTDPSAQNASRLQAARLGADAILLAWEEWTPSEYRATYIQVLDMNGDTLLEPTRVSDAANLRLFRSDDPLSVEHTVILVDGTATGFRVWQFEVD